MADSTDSNTRAHAADAAPGSHGFATEPASGLVPAGVDPIARHTLGPWYADNHGLDDGNTAIRADVAPNPRFPWDKTVARVGSRSDPHRDANARLISAAPDLLVALRHARRAMIVGVTGVADGLTIHDIRSWIELTDAAIRKAEGL